MQELGDEEYEFTYTLRGWKWVDDKMERWVARYRVTDDTKVTVSPLYKELVLACMGTLTLVGLYATSFSLSSDDNLRAAAVAVTISSSMAAPLFLLLVISYLFSDVSNPDPPLDPFN